MLAGALFIPDIYNLVANAGSVTRRHNECEVACRGYQKKIPVVFQPVRTIDTDVGRGSRVQD